MQKYITDDIEMSSNESDKEDSDTEDSDEYSNFEGAIYIIVGVFLRKKNLLHAVFKGTYLNFQSNYSNE